MQCLATVGYEGGQAFGLGWISGEVVRLKSLSPSDKVPHVGWNNVEIIRSDYIFNELNSDENFYFVHGYHFNATNRSNVLGVTDYCGGVAAVIAHENIVGVQFHPEKSQKAGFKVLNNFLERG